ncbi:MAG: DUF4249 family protein [Balneola sp.]
MKLAIHIRKVIARSFLKKKKPEDNSAKQSFYSRVKIKYNQISASITNQIKFYFQNSSQRLLLIFISSLIFTSCSIESLPISVEPAEEQIAVASLIGPEETFFVVLSRSFSALSAEDVNDLTNGAIDRLFLDRALVTLEYEGVTDTLEKVFDINGLYGTELQTFEDFQMLSLSVFDSSTSETISAQSMLLPQIEIDSVTVTRDPDGFDDSAILTYNIIDRPEDNFFVVQAYQLTDSDTSSSGSTQNGFFFNNDTFLIYEELVTDLGVSEDGVIRKEEFISFSSPVDSALVVITNISEGYYRFLEARRRSGGVISSLANEPVNHPTNVENGVGYFSAHRPWATLVIVE